MTKQVNIDITANNTSAVSAFSDLSAKMEQFSGQFSKFSNDMENKTSKMTSGMSVKVIALGNIIANVATKAFGKLIETVRESDEAYQDLSASRTKLATVMGQRGATQQEYDDLIRLTEAEERLGVVSRSAMQNGLQELATYVGKAESLERLTGVMNTLAVQQHGYNVSSEQMLQIGTMMGKVLQGQTGGLERIGYHLSEDEKKIFTFGTEEERVATLTSIVNENIGDVNRRLGETNVGRQIQLANAFAYLKAQIGEVAYAFKSMFLPVLTTIVNALSRVLAYVKAFLKLFGVQFGNSAAQTSAVFGDASDAVSDYGDSVSKTAKKIKGSLATFDEMNVLTEQTASSAGGGGGGEAVDILGDFEPNANPIDWGSIIGETEATEIMNRLAEAFKKFGEDVASAFGHIKNIASDVWNNYLKPFLMWVGTSAIPAVLDAIGGAIQFVGSLLETYYFNYLKPFLDEFLVPLGKWTGGKIVDILNGFGDSLRNLASNPEALDKIAGVLDKIIKIALGFKGASAVLTGFNTVTTFANGIIGNFADKGLPTLAENSIAGAEGIAKGSTAFSKFSGIAGKVSGVAGKLFGLIAAHPFVALGVALGALLLTNEDFRKSLLELLENVLKPIMAFIQGLWDLIKPVLDFIIEAVKKIIENLAPKIEAFIAKLTPIFTKIFDAIGEIMGIVTELIEAIMPPLEELISMLMDALEPIIDAILEVLDAIFEILNPIIDMVMAFLDAVLPIITDIVRIIAQQLANAIKNVIAILKIVIEIITAVIKVAVEVITAIIQFVADAIAKFMEIITAVFNWLNDNIIKPVWDFIKQVIENITSWVQSNIEAIVGFFEGLWNAIQEIFSAIGNWISDTFKNAVQGIKDFFSPLINWFGDLWNRIKDKFVKIGQGIGEAVGGAFKTVVNGILNAVENILNVPIRAINGLISVINNVPGIDLGYLTEINLPRLEKGGIVDKATLAMVGENGREAIVPLENNTGWIDELAKKIGTGDETIIVKIGEETVVDTFIEKIKEKSYNRNRNVFA